MFSIKEAVVFGWHKLKANSGLSLGVVLALFALQVVSSMVEKTLEGTVIGFAASLILAALGVVLGCGMTLIFLRLAKGEHAQFSDIVPSIAVVWKYFCSSLLVGVISFLPLMAGSLLALIVLVSTGSINFSEGLHNQANPGVLALAGVIVAVALAYTAYLSLRFSMAKLVVLERGEIVESLRQSTTLTHGVKWRLVLLVLALAGLNILGLLALVVGLLVTVPMSMFAFAHVYLKLKARHGHQ